MIFQDPWSMWPGGGGGYPNSYDFIGVGKETGNLELRVGVEAIAARASINIHQ